MTIEEMIEDGFAQIQTGLFRLNKTKGPAEAAFEVGILIDLFVQDHLNYLRLAREHNENVS